MKKKISKLDEEIGVDESETAPEDNMKNGEFVIPIIGDIGWDVTADSVSAQLEKADGQDVVFEIASPGGSVFEGVEIFNAIRNYEGKTEARITGMAASMASYIPLAADKVLAEDNATYMIHNAWGVVIGDCEEMKAEAEILESINGMIAAKYVEKTGKKEKDVLEMMSNETWLFGEEMKKEGFVDEMIVHKDSGKSGGNKANKESALAAAKDKFKSTLSKTREDRMKSDIDKMKASLASTKAKQATSKFTETEGTLFGIIQALRDMSTNRKPDDEVIVPVSRVKLLIDDLESVQTHMKTLEAGETKAEAKPGDEEPKDEEPKDPPKDEEPKKEPDKEPEAEPPKDTEKGKEDKPDEGADDTPDEGGEDAPPAEDPEKKEDKPEGESKFSELLKVCEGYQAQIEKKDVLISKFQDENKALKKELTDTNSQVSKFSEDRKMRLLNDTVQKVSKFHGMDDQGTLALKTRYLKQGLGEAALEEIGRATDAQMLSKLEEPRPATVPSEHLAAAPAAPAEPPRPLSKDEQIEQLAMENAIEKGYVLPN